ncbi:MAG: hypothetical protein ACHQUC_02355 [Chlamydiales bacterium]
MVSSGFSLSSNTISQLQLIFETRNTTPILNGVTTTSIDVSSGIHSLESDDVGALQELYNKCVGKGSDNIISVKRTSDIFLSIFQENITLSKAREQLENPDKWIRSQAKREIKNEINVILSKFEGMEIVDKIKEVNNNPRLVETRYALSLGVMPQKIKVRNVCPVYILYDRRGPESGKALAIFKECIEEEVKAEVDAWEVLREPNNINIKQTEKAEFEIRGSKKEGIFQKFIKGKMIREKQEPPDQEAVDQIQLIGIFDLINLNPDRNDGNIMIDQKNKVWAIDHARVKRGNPYHDDRMPMMSTIQAATEPFSQRLIDHINNLDVKVHVSESIQADDNRKMHVANIIKFLKWSVADERKLRLTHSQIYSVLYEYESSFESGTFEHTNENYQKMLKIALNRLVEHKATSGGILRGAIPEIDICLKPSDWESDFILEKCNRLGSFSSVQDEIYIDLVIENRDRITHINTENIRHFHLFSIEKRFKMLAEGTKYFDKVNNSYSKELIDFLGRFDAAGKPLTLDVTSTDKVTESTSSSSTGEMLHS